MSGQGGKGHGIRMEISEWGKRELSQIEKEGQELGRQVKALADRLHALTSPEGLVKLCNFVFDPGV